MIVKLVWLITELLTWWLNPKTPVPYPLEHYTPSEKRIKNAVDRELSAMGYQKQTTGKPDFLIVYIITFADEPEDQLEDKLEQTLREYEYMRYGYKGFYDAEEQESSFTKLVILV